jgi:hypothetical protein
MSLRPGRNKQSLNSAIFSDASVIKRGSYNTSSKLFSGRSRQQKDQRMPAERHARIHFVKIGSGTDISRTAYGRK